MKNILLFITVLISLSSYSQNLNFNQIYTLKGKNIAQAEEFLTSKDWSFTGSENGIVDFSYGQTSYGNTAESYISLYLNNLTSNIDWVEIQIVKKEKYNDFINSIKNDNYKLLDSKLSDDGSIIKFYQNNSSTIRIKIIDTKKDQIKTVYLFMIVPLEDYKHIE